MPTSPRTPRCSRAHRSAPLSAALVVALVTGGLALASSSAEAQAAARRAPASHLLATDAMPTAGVEWSGTDTEADDLGVVGPCHLASLFDIGAVSTVRRTWTSTGLSGSTGSTPRAVQVVARFADSRSAWRAHQVLGSWHEDCDETEVGGLRDVRVPTGVGQAYRVVHGARASDVGILRRGAWISVVVVLAPAAQVPASSTLARSAVRRIAATF